MKSSKNSQEHFNILNSRVGTYMEESSEESETPRLNTLEAAVDELEQLCAYLEQEKTECNLIRNQTYQLIQSYQQYQNKIEEYIHESYEDGVALTETNHYTMVATAKAQEYLNSKKKEKAGERTIKCIEKGKERSRVLKRLNQSLRSPQVMRR